MTDIQMIIAYIATFIFGAVFGSFACCQAWRIHEKDAGKKLGSRSICMHCKKKLSWYDNIPIVSWLMLRGKCRFCKKSIGFAEILSEIGLGLTFLAVALVYGFEVTSFIFMASLIPFLVLLVYDAKWGELPVALMLINILLAVSYQFANHGDWFQIGISVAILSGIYYLLYFFSKEKWVGGGDWILCISIAIFLGHFEFALVELFLANFLASIVGIPSTFKKKNKQIPFGPFLIIALVIIYLLAPQISKFLLLSR